MTELEMFKRQIEQDTFEGNPTAILELAQMNGGTSILLTKAEDFTDEARKAREQATKHIRQGYRDILARHAVGKEDYPIPLWSLDVWNDVKAAIPEAERSKLDRTLSTVLYGRDPNAWTIWHPTGSIIAIDMALLPILEYMNQAMLRVRQRVNTAGGLSEGFYRSVLAPYLMYFYVLPSPSALPGTVGMTKPAYLLLKSLCRHQTHFIYGHEIGHVILGHNNGEKRLGVIPNSGSTHVEMYQRDQDAEFGADAFGLRVLMGTATRRSKVGAVEDPKEVTDDKLLDLAADLSGAYEHAHLGLELLFVYFEAFEKTTRHLVRTLHGSEIHEELLSHPPAPTRLERLRKASPWFELDPENQELVSLSRTALVDVWVKYLESLSGPQIAELIQQIKSGGQA